ncbi:hypothetical protein, partial [Klebsiella pneumoniae]
RSSAASDVYKRQEYTRMFGESPKRDITELRKSAGKL